MLPPAKVEKEASAQSFSLGSATALKETCQDLTMSNGTTVLKTATELKTWKRHQLRVQSTRTSSLSTAPSTGTWSFTSGNVAKCWHSYKNN